MIQLPYLIVMFLVGVVLVLFAIGMTIVKKGYSHAFWYESSGVWLVVLSLFLALGSNNTCFYPSNTNPQSSLTIYNSSSSLFTLEVMAYVSLLLPVVIIYGFIAWRAMDKKRIQASDFGSTGDGNM